LACLCHLVFSLSRIIGISYSRYLVFSLSRIIGISYSRYLVLSVSRILGISQRDNENTKWHKQAIKVTDYGIQPNRK